MIVTDTLGLLITVVVYAASMQDRDGAKPGVVAGLPRHAGADRVRRRRIHRAAAGVDRAFPAHRNRHRAQGPWPVGFRVATGRSCG
jgi:hypothetical protein